MSNKPYAIARRKVVAGGQLVEGSCLALVGRFT